MLPFEQRPKYDKIIIYAVQGSKFKCCDTTQIMRRNKASKQAS
jgi:hypothetical protein